MSAFGPNWDSLNNHPTSWGAYNAQMEAQEKAMVAQEKAMEAQMKAQEEDMEARFQALRRNPPRGSANQFELLEESAARRNVRMDEFKKNLSEIGRLQNQLLNAKTKEEVEEILGKIDNIQKK